MANTALSLLYRDGANYKTTSVTVFSGVPSADLVARLRGACDAGLYLVPAQVDLAHPAEVDQRFAQRFPAPDDDHAWVEIYGIDPTDTDPTDDRDLATFVADCEAVGPDGWDPEWAITEAHGGWRWPARPPRHRARVDTPPPTRKDPP